MIRQIDPRRLMDGIRSGNRRALARTITLIENEKPEAQDILTGLYPETGRARIIGVTGAPGTGKSTLVNTLTGYIRQQDKTVSVIAVDPSSPFTRGAILGDRIRMRDLSGDSGVFIRSMATRGNLGGPAHMTPDVARILDAAGFDFIIIETVGAGQNEVAIARTAQTTLLVEAPGMGDDIQAAKAGIMEIADILVVNKADRPGVNNTVRALKAMLDLGHRMQAVVHHGQSLIQRDGDHIVPEIDTWQVPVLKTIASDITGIPELYQAILDHIQHLHESGQWDKRERVRLENEIMERLQYTLLLHQLRETSPDHIESLLQQVTARSLSPHQAVQQLIARKD